MPSDSSHPRDPLHGITLETIVTRLVERYGWTEMGDRIPVRCFLNNPSVKSSLTFLRKTPWARKRVEDWFIAECQGLEPES
ncbi:MAG TPA: VF530 family protein [Chthoniobacter sp.]|nr:VF530 family protein [Chthoniobacter sp.]